MDARVKELEAAMVKDVAIEHLRAALKRHGMTSRDVKPELRAALDRPRPVETTH